jgi:hypothetical protein
MRRPSSQYPFTCVTCELKIAGRAVLHAGLPFCCAGCAADGPCNCSYDDEPPDDDPAGDPTAYAPTALGDGTRGLAHARR